jgi:hypothetical protein
MINKTSINQWSLDIEKYRHLKTERETECFLSLIEDAEAVIEKFPLDIGVVLFSIFSSHQDHGVYQSVYSAIKLLNVRDYYFCLIENIERLKKDDFNNHWRTTLLSYAARPLQYSDYPEILSALSCFEKNKIEIFLNEIKYKNDFDLNNFLKFYLKNESA